jgi:hypothetical protein
MDLFNFDILCKYILFYLGYLLFMKMDTYELVIYPDSEFRLFHRHK